MEGLVDLNVLMRDGEAHSMRRKSEVVIQEKAETGSHSHGKPRFGPQQGNSSIQSSLLIGISMNLLKGGPSVYFWKMGRENRPASCGVQAPYQIKKSQIPRHVCNSRTEEVNEEWRMQG